MYYYYGIIITYSNLHVHEQCAKWLRKYSKSIKINIFLNVKIKYLH